MHSSTTIVGVVIGVVILFFGRKLFWLCVAAVGFAVGVQIAPLLVNEASSLLALVIALVLGVLGAFLAFFIQKVAIAVPRVLSRRKARHGDRSCVLCAVCAILDHHLRHRRHYWGNSIAGRVWLGTDRCVLVYRRVLDSKRNRVAADRLDTRVYRPRNPGHIRAGDIVPQTCDIKRADHY